MAMKVNSINIGVHNSKIKKMPLFKKETPVKEKIDFDATNIMQDSHLNFFDRFMFKTLDAISPIMAKHTILKNNIIKLTERIIKTNSNI